MEVITSKRLLFKDVETMKDLIKSLHSAIISAVYGNEKNATVSKINKLADQEQEFLGTVQYVRRL